MKYHILGISGSMTTPLAIELHRQGHIVSGSDQDLIYPPASIELSKANIKINQALPEADLYIVGSSYKNHPRTQAEFDTIISKKLPYISATEFVAKNICCQDSILVAGSYAKSTISSLLIWIFTSLGLKLNYFTGGRSLNHLPSLYFGESTWSIVEADESINGLDKQAKFLYYPVRYLILTSTAWEHKDSYPSYQDNLNAYINLVKNIPTNGILVYNSKDKDILQVLPYCKGLCIPSSNFKFQTDLIGQHNIDNINMALSMCQALNLDIDRIISLLPQFKGISRRLEIVSNTNNILIIDDFAQSPDRVKAALKAISTSFRNRPLKVFFEPHASFLSYKNSLNGFKDAFTDVDQVLLSKIRFLPSNDKLKRTTFKDYQSEVGQKIKYFPIIEELKSYLNNNLKPNDILVHFSSGGLEGINLIRQIGYTGN